MGSKHSMSNSGKAETNGRLHTGDEREAVKAEITIMQPPEKEEEGKKFVPKVKRTDPKLTGRGHFNPKPDALETANPEEEATEHEEKPGKKKRAKKAPEPVKAIAIYSLDTAPEGRRPTLENPGIPFLSGLVVTTPEDGKEPVVTDVLLRGGRTEELFSTTERLGFPQAQSTTSPSFEVVPVEKRFGLVAGPLSHAAEVLLANPNHYNLPPGLTKTLEGILEDRGHLQGMPLSEDPLNPPSGWTIGLNADGKTSDSKPAPRSTKTSKG